MCRKWPISFSLRSSAKFWQMIGRGTRLRPDLFGPVRHKEHFLVFDFCQNFEFFNQNPALTEGALGISLGAKLFKTRVELVGEILQKQETDEVLSGLRQSVTDRLFDEVAGISLDNFIVRPKRRFVEKFQTRNAWEQLGPDERAELAEHIAGLPSAYEDDDLAAKQFDYLVLQAQARRFARLLASTADEAEALGSKRR
jgi:type I restriction enzyme, R subunit